MTPLTPRALQARRLPVPSTISPELQQSIAALTLATPAEAAPPPQSAEGWRAFIAERDRQSLALNPLLASAFPYTAARSVIADVCVYEVTPASFDPSTEGRVLLNFHGGGYVLYGGEACLPEAVLAAHHARARVLAVDYRMPPDHPFPAAVDDAVAVFNALAAQHGASRIGVFGTSAGGGLVLALVHKLKALGAPFPGALALGTPWADLLGQGDTVEANMGVDSVLTSAEALAAMARLYANGASLTDPLISPVYGDFAGFPPAILTTGTRDVLLSDTVRVHRALRAAGVEAQLEVYEAMSHAEYIYAFNSPESASAFREIARFFAARL